MAVLILAVSAWVAPSALSEEEEEECTDEHVHVVHASASMTVTPPFIVICEGKVLTLNMIPPNKLGLGTVVSAPKPSNPDEHWLDGANTPNPNQIVLPVPAGKAGSTYEYSVTIEDLGKIDPRVRVKK